MALFSTHDERENVDPEQISRVAPSERRVRRGWILLAIAFMLILVLGVAPAPYVIEQPGPVFNTLGTTEHSGQAIPLIQIPGKKTYPTAGTLHLLTVEAVGNPQQLPNWLEVITGWFEPSKAVIPVDVAYPPSVTVKEQRAQNQVLMADSQKDAIAAALNEQGYDYPQKVDVKQVIAGSPAAGKLAVGDQIRTFNGKSVAGVQSLRNAVAANGTTKAAAVGIVRKGQSKTVQVTPEKSGKAVVLGVGVAMDYTFPFTVKIELDNVGGPSAGMMFALGIIDKLTPGELNGGKRVAGTGTIDNEGNVGPIGGIRQKLYAASGAGDRWFLAPASNCDEVVGHVPGELHVVAVKTLNDSLAALKAIAAGTTSRLPSCKAG